MAVFLVIAIVCISTFIFVEKRHKDPILPLYLMKNPLSDLFVLFAVNWATATALSWLLPYILNDAQLAGIANSLSFVVVLLSTFITLFAQKKLVNRYIIYVGYIGSFGCLLATMFLMNNPIATFILIILSSFFNGTI